jgi:hypothetical protein
MANRYDETITANDGVAVHHFVQPSQNDVTLFFAQLLLRALVKKTNSAAMAVVDGCSVLKEPFNNDGWHPALLHAHLCVFAEHDGWPPN